MIRRQMLLIATAMIMMGMAVPVYAQSPVAGGDIPTGLAPFEPPGGGPGDGDGSTGPIPDEGLPFDLGDFDPLGPISVDGNLPQG